jgi:dihydroorotate dehydrogenase (fumarate)
MKELQVMDLSTTYMGLRLKNPLVPAAGPLAADLGSIRQAEDAGAAAVVLPSLFEEQITAEAEELDQYLTQGTESFAESLTYFPAPSEFLLGPDEYLEHVARAKRAIDIPLIASLNGVSTGGWTGYAKKIESAGADALELNIYIVAADPKIAGTVIEDRYLEIVKAVKQAVWIPVAVKTGSFFSSIAAMANRFDELGVDALVLFNRFYQPDIDLENLEVVPKITLSGPEELRLPLRWIAVLHGKLRASLASARGVSNARDVLKLLMVGADVTQLLSVLLRKGVGELSVILEDMQAWMRENEYESVEQMKGSMSQKACPDPAAFERANYMRVLQSYP